jgi:cytochrome c oxidase assembly protein subunit 11
VTRLPGPEADPAAAPATARAGARGAGNSAMMRRLLVVALLMFGFGWALVPLYKKICEVTGINLLTGKDPAAEARARNTQVDYSRTITIEFDANGRGAWHFRPEVRHLQVHPGELVHVTYDLVNQEPRTVAGQAIPSYAPVHAGPHFSKIECFCFQQHVLKAGETKRFPVVFFIDPALPADVKSITLSYTFFEVPGAAPVDAAAAAAAAGGAPGG